MNTNNQLLDKGICPHCLGNIRLNFTRKWTECNCGDPANYHGEWPLVFSEFQDLQIQNRAFGKIYPEQSHRINELEPIRIGTRLVNYIGESIAKVKFVNDIVNGLAEKTGICVCYELFNDPVKFQVDEYQEAKKLSIPNNPKIPSKEIALSVLIDSGIDCEFGSGDQFFSIGKFTRFESNEYSGRWYNTDAESWFPACRPRMNYWHAAVNLVSCPIPDGFVIKINDADDFLTGECYLKMNWYSVDQFMIVDIQPGWQLPCIGAK